MDAATFRAQCETSLKSKLGTGQEMFVTDVLNAICDDFGRVPFTKETFATIKFDATRLLRLCEEKAYLSLTESEATFVVQVLLD